MLKTSILAFLICHDKKIKCPSHYTLAFLCKGLAIVDSVSLPSMESTNMMYSYVPFCVSIPSLLSHLDRTKSTSLAVNMIVNRGIRALTMAHLFVSASPGFGFA